MQWTCDKCGKTVQISAEQLAETEGAVVCPQCLATDVVPGYKRRSKRKRQAPAPPPPEPTPPPHRKNVAMQQPPAHRKTISFVDQPAPQRSGQQSSPSAPATGKPKKKKKSKKKSRNKGFFAPHSALGCLWRSVVYTLLLLLLYSALGFLLQCT